MMRYQEDQIRQCLSLRMIQFQLSRFQSCLRMEPGSACGPFFEVHPSFLPKDSCIEDLHSPIALRTHHPFQSIGYIFEYLALISLLTIECSSTGPRKQKRPVWLSLDPCERYHRSLYRDLQVFLRPQKRPLLRAKEQWFHLS